MNVIPDHSTFSKTRLRKWNESCLFQEVFWEIIRRCVKSGFVDGKELAADGTYLPANVSKDSWIDTEVEAELSMQSYLDRLDEERSKQPGFKRPPAKIIKKRRTTSKTDPDSGKRGTSNNKILTAIAIASLFIGSSKIMGFLPESR